MPAKRQDDSSVFQLYDMGDSWQHEVVVEKVLPPEPATRYPMCVAGERACPPEDVGSIWGYAHFLEAIQQPNHPEHEDMLTWVGGSFDPEALHIETVNRIMKRV